MLNFKKSQTQKVIGITLGILTLLILIFFTTSTIKNSTYSISLTQCNIFFEKIEGQPVYFSNKLNSATNVLFDQISNTCASKDFQITKDNILPAIDLVEDCWTKTGKSIDILPSLILDEGVCVYCGSIYSKKEINSFDKLFIKEFQKNKELLSKITSNKTETLNMNKLGLLDSENLPKTLNEDTTIDVIYYIYNPGIVSAEKNNIFTSIDEGIDMTETKLLQFFGNTNKYTTLTTYYLSKKSTNSFSGINLIQRDLSSDLTNINNDDNNENLKNILTPLNCKLIIPKTHYE